MEEDTGHLNPLTPAKNYRKSDEQFATRKPFNPKRHERSSKFLVYMLLAVVLLSIAFLVFSLVVLRIKSPTLRLSTVAIKDLHYDSSPSLTMTLVAKIRLHNMNFGCFKFRGGKATLLYENAKVGAMNIHGGRVGSREKRGIRVTVKVTGMSKKLSHHFVNLSRDMGLGLLKISSFGKLRGEVRVVKIINRRRTAVLNCTMDLNLTSRAIQDLSCQ